MLRNHGLTAFVFILCLGSHSLPALAAPDVPFSRAQADIARDWGKGGRKPAVKARGRFQQELNWENGVQILVGYYPVNVVSPTKKKGVTSVVDSTAIYHYLGGKWVFKSSTVGEGRLEGMPPVDTKLISFSSLPKLFPDRTGIWNRIVKVQTILIPDDHKDTWHSFRSVETDVHVSFVYLDGRDLIGTLEKRRVRFYRDGDDGPFTRDIITSKTVTKAERTTLSEEDAKQMLSIWEAKEAAEMKANKKEIPKFSDPQEGCAWVYGQLMGNGTDDDIRFTLAYMMDYAANFEPGKMVLNQYGQSLSRKVIEVRAKMKEQYPPQFTFVGTSAPFVYFERTDKRTNGICRIWQGDTPGVMVLGDLDIPTL